MHNFAANQIHLDDKLNFNLHISNTCRSPANQIHLDDKLNFNLHISNTCRSATNQIHLDDRLNYNLHINHICRSANVFIRLKSYLNFNAKRVLINSYIIWNFNYCLLAWIFPTAKSLNKVESLQKRALLLWLLNILWRFTGKSRKSKNECK